MKNSIERNRPINHYQNELKGALAGMDHERAGHMPAPDAADAPGPIFILIAFAATALILAGVALSLVA